MITSWGDEPQLRGFIRWCAPWTQGKFLRNLFNGGPPVFKWPCFFGPAEVFKNEGGINNPRFALCWKTLFWDLNIFKRQQTSHVGGQIFQAPFRTQPKLSVMVMPEQKGMPSGYQKMWIIVALGNAAFCSMTSSPLKASTCRGILNSQLGIHHFHPGQLSTDHPGWPVRCFNTNVIQCVVSVVYRFASIKWLSHSKNQTGDRHTAVSASQRDRDCRQLYHTCMIKHAESVVRCKTQFCWSDPSNSIWYNWPVILYTTVISMICSWMLINTYFYLIAFYTSRDVC